MAEIELSLVLFELVLIAAVTAEVFVSVEETESMNSSTDENPLAVADAPTL